MLKISGTKYNTVALDFETYYETGVGDAYSLRNPKLNTSEYIRDRRFEVHCVGIKVNGNKTRTYEGDGINRALRAIDWSRAALLCHNTYFDGFILSHHYGIVPAFYLDTMCMGRAVHGAHSRASLDYLAKLHGLAGKVHGQALVNTAGKSIADLTKTEIASLKQYCADDVNDTHALFNILLPHVPDDELRLIDATIRMFTQPTFLLDAPRARAELKREIEEKRQTMERVSATCTVDDLRSDSKFAELLIAAGQPPPMKISPANGKAVYAFAKTDLDFLDLAENGSPEVQALCTARIRNKTSTNETRAERLLKAGADGMPIPVMLNYCQAHTFRWSGGNKMNLQNLMRGGELRRSLLAPKGHKVVVADSAQIEARVLAWLAGESAVVEAFAAKKDVYKLTASLIYGKPPEDITKVERFVGKVATLGLGYGMGGAKFNDTLASGAMGDKIILPQEETTRIVRAYRARNAHITRLWARGEAILASMIYGTEGSYGPISWGKQWMRMPNGLYMHYREMDGEVYTDRTGSTRVSNVTYAGKNGARMYIYGGKLVENICQSLARCIVADQMLTINEHYRVVTTTHDEIVAICPTKEAKKCLGYMVGVMSTPPDWAEGLPLSAEGDYDNCYSK